MDPGKFQYKVSSFEHWEHQKCPDTEGGAGQPSFYPPVFGERRRLVRVIGSAPTFRKEGDMNFRLCLRIQRKIVNWTNEANLL